MRLVTCIALYVLFISSDVFMATGGPLGEFYNGNSIELWILVEEDPKFLNEIGHSLVRTTIRGIIDELYSDQSSTRFAVGFYGASNQIRWAVPPGTSDATLAKAMLKRFEYSGKSFTNSSLVLSLNDLSLACNKSTCRDNVPRVLVIMAHDFNGTLEEYMATNNATIKSFTADCVPNVLTPSCTPLNSTLNSTLRQLEAEKLFTIIIVGVGVEHEKFSYLASEPSDLFSVAVDSLTLLPVLPLLFENVISKAPRSVELGTRITFPDEAVNRENNLQLNIDDSTKQSDSLVSLALRCKDCDVFASLNNSRPTSKTAFILYPTHHLIDDADISIYYFRISRGTKRLFFNIEIYLMENTEAWINIFPIPSVLSESVVRKVKKAEFPVLRFNAESSA